MRIIDKDVLLEKRNHDRCLLMFNDILSTKIDIKFDIEYTKLRNELDEKKEKKDHKFLIEKAYEHEVSVEDIVAYKANFKSDEEFIQLILIEKEKECERYIRSRIGYAYQNDDEKKKIYQKKYMIIHKDGKIFLLKNY